MLEGDEWQDATGNAEIAERMKAGAGHTVWEEFELHVSGLFRCDRERQFGLIGAMQWDRTLSTDLSLFLYGIRTLHSNRSRRSNGTQLKKLFFAPVYANRNPENGGLKHSFRDM